jgi:hypothetical protein
MQINRISSEHDVVERMDNELQSSCKTKFGSNERKPVTYNNGTPK